jgi:hypothetical protein
VLPIEPLLIGPGMARTLSVTCTMGAGLQTLVTRWSEADTGANLQRPRQALKATTV